MLLLVFTLDDRNCALELSMVEKVYRAVAITPLPRAPDIVLGIVNVKGVVLPVVDIRRRFRLPEKKLTPDHQLIVAQAAGRRLVVLVDHVAGVIECAPKAVTETGNIVPGIEHVAGVARLEDGIILIHDLKRFLSLEEAAALDRALQLD
ncbi:MAG: chemotaxis protein CheW [Methylomonas sp.]|jgi:purine-binding chemotaxis protein CheW|uniref:chemotaxis protein CheW n=1 Tax=Methylomonas sp. TaxID=418 RepID=UPI0025D1B16F|nr:chemotaxis protein CheW [Methylomonas sp.]MCK9607489.1 chemotaxis protein CheW [Methylomonas sp.]